ncbi:MAG: site-specific integrase, partial [Acidobacteriota bacterium]|nr:site-specific integrase [Acidobacteriota bacterium]
MAAGSTLRHTASPQDSEAAGRRDPHEGARLVLDFLAYLELERGLARNTLAAYRTDLFQLSHFLAARGVRLEAATHGDLAAFLAALTVAETHGARPGAQPGPRPLAPATLQRKLAGLRSFYRHLRREELMAHDPTADLRGPRASARLPKV